MVSASAPRAVPAQVSRFPAAAPSCSAPKRLYSSPSNSGVESNQRGSVSGENQKPSTSSIRGSATAIAISAFRVVVEHLAHRGGELLERERLRQKAEVRAFRQVTRKCVLGKARDEDELHVRIALADLAQQRRAVHFRHDDVGDDHVHLAFELVENVERLDTGAGLVNGIATG